MIVIKESNKSVQKGRKFGRKSILIIEKVIGILVVKEGVDVEEIDCEFMDKV